MCLIDGLRVGVGDLALAVGEPELGGGAARRPPAHRIIMATAVYPWMT